MSAKYLRDFLELMDAWVEYHRDETLAYNSRLFDEDWPETRGNDLTPYDHNYTFGELLEAVLEEQQGRIPSWKRVKSILRKPLPSPAQIREAVARGEEAFWAEVVNHFPEVTTGDYPPEGVDQLQEQLDLHVQRWLKHNHPGMRGES